MFYEPDKAKKGSGKLRKKGRMGCFFRLLLLLAAVYVAVTAACSSTLSGLTRGLIPDGLPGGWRNILLMGSDTLDGQASRTDSIIVVSVSTGGKVKLTSIMRDMMVPMGEYGRHKINAAYTLGGPQFAVDTVNACLGLNIKQYAVVDFEGFAKLIDAVGGISVDITKAEMKAMNQKKGHKLKNYGENIKLDGVQALRYARIRKIDSDYVRVSRQRTIIEAVLRKVRTVKNPVALFKIAKSGLETVDTNMSVFDMISVSGRALLNKSQVQQYRVPADGTYESGTLDGVWSIRPDFETNRQKLLEFIYQ